MVTIETSQPIARGPVLEPLPAEGTAPASGPGRLGVVERVRGLSIPTKVLVANATIVVFGAIAGTWVTVYTVGADDRGAIGARLVPIFVGIGIIVSLVVNLLVLRAAFRPLLLLERAAEAVRSGDVNARVDPTALLDPHLARLAGTFNGTLEALARDRAELRSLAMQVIRAQEEERKRISRELHDDTAQILFAQLLRLTALKDSPNPEVRRTVKTLEEMTAEALEGVRRLALELRPPALDDLGLAAALGELVQRIGDQMALPIDYVDEGARRRLPAEVELVLYRVAQEGLTNVAKHAQARQVNVRLERTDHDVTLSVVDDGVGFSPSSIVTANDSGLGLFGMEERIELINGLLRIWSRPGEGTEVFAFVPLPEPHAKDQAS